MEHAGETDRAVDEGEGEWIDDDARRGQIERWMGGDDRKEVYM